MKKKHRRKIQEQIKQLIIERDYIAEMDYSSIGGRERAYSVARNLNRVIGELCTLVDEVS